MCKLSIIIPIFNVESYLRDCLNSVLRQTYSDYEVIMINDGSTDGSQTIAEEYAVKYSNFILINQDNKGLSAARNAGLKRANGKYIIFIDSDDYWKSNSLRYLMTTIEEKDVSLFVFSGDIDIYDESNNLVVTKYGYNNKFYTCSDGLELFNILNCQNLYKTGVYYYIFKRETFEKYNLFFIEGILHEDHYFTLMLFLLTKGLSLYEGLSFYGYRIRHNSIMTSSKRYIERFKGFATTVSKLTCDIPPFMQHDPVIQEKVKDIYCICLKYFLHAMVIFKIKISDVKMLKETTKMYIQFKQSNEI